MHGATVKKIICTNSSVLFFCLFLKMIHRRVKKTPYNIISTTCFGLNCHLRVEQD